MGLVGSKNCQRIEVGFPLDFEQGQFERTEDPPGTGYWVQMGYVRVKVGALLVLRLPILICFFQPG